MNYRTQLEKESEKLLSMLPHARPDERGRGVRRLREIADEIALLDNGEHWTQTPGDTLSRIVAVDVAASHKKFNGGE